MYGSFPHRVFRRSRNIILASWYVTMCHELAHNKWELHDVKHERELQNLVVHYMPQLQELLQRGP